MNSSIFEGPVAPIIVLVHKDIVDGETIKTQIIDCTDPTVSSCQRPHIHNAIATSTEHTAIHMYTVRTEQKRQIITLTFAMCKSVHHDLIKLTWLVLGGDPTAHSHRVEQLTAL